MPAGEEIGLRTPLGQDLDVGGFSIISSANGNIILAPHGSGKVGIGTASPLKRCQIEKAGDVQVRLAYDASVYTDFEQKSGGTLHITSTNNVRINSDLTLSGSVTLDNNQSFAIKETGGAGRIIIHVNGSDEVLVGATHADMGDLHLRAGGVDPGITLKATTGYVQLPNDGQLFQLGAVQDYTIEWDGDDAVHTISAGSFVFTGGNMGIGTATPASLLNLDGGFSLAAGGLTFGDGDTGFYEAADDVMYYNLGGISRWKYAGDVITGIRADMHIEVGSGTSTTVPRYTFYLDANTGIGTPAADAVNIITGGIERVRVDSSGNMGIGTATPHYPSTVNGGLGLIEKSADPAEPAEGETVIWMSDGTAKGDDGDVLIASKAGGVTKWTTLLDHSTGNAW